MIFHIIPYLSETSTRAKTSSPARKWWYGHSSASRLLDRNMTHSKERSDPVRHAVSVNIRRGVMAGTKFRGASKTRPKSGMPQKYTGNFDRSAAAHRRIAQAGGGKQGTTFHKLRALDLMNVHRALQGRRKDVTKFQQRWKKQGP